MITRWSLGFRIQSLKVIKCSWGESGAVPSRVHNPYLSGCLSGSLAREFVWGATCHSGPDVRSRLPQRGDQDPISEPLHGAHPHRPLLWGGKDISSSQPFREHESHPSEHIQCIVFVCHTLGSYLAFGVSLGGSWE